MRGVRAYTTVDDTPVDVRKEGVDVLSSLSGRIVEEERMLPDIHDEDRLKPGDSAVLVQGHPVVAEMSG
jgi:hypothetical protein